MARQTGNKGSSGELGNSKFRLIVLEADLAGGDLSHLAHAITNALRPATSHQYQPRLPSAPTPIASVQNGALEDGAGADDVDLDDAEQAVPTVNERVAISSARRERKRRYRDPKIVDDLDVVGSTGTTWSQFANEKKSQSRQKKFLTAMTWFKNHGGKGAIGIDEVYTAFRTPGVDWPYAFQDYDKTFRALVHQDLAGRTETGLYAINVVGEGKVDKKGDD